MGNDHHAVEHYLPQKYWSIAATYPITNEFLANDPDLVVLILDSRSLASYEDKSERFGMYAEMTPDQKQGLKDILIREKEQLAAIEEQFPNEEG